VLSFLGVLRIGCVPARVCFLGGVLDLFEGRACRPLLLFFACLPCSLLLGGVLAGLASFWGRACSWYYFVGACLLFWLVLGASLPCSPRLGDVPAVLASFGGFYFGSVPAVLTSFLGRLALLVSFWGRSCRARIFLGSCLPSALLFWERACHARFYFGSVPAVLTSFGRYEG
jgi:hypothetical protein